MDDELKGEGNSINYKYRMHDPRVGRFFAVDPLFREYPYNSPYAFSENRVIDARELEGLEMADTDLWMHDRRDYILKNGTAEERKAYIEREGKYVLGIPVALIDIFLTRGRLSMSLAGGSTLEAINETERGYDAKRSGNIEEYQRRLDNSGEATKDLIFELFGGALGRTVGRLLDKASDLPKITNKARGFKQENPIVGPREFYKYNSEIKNGYIYNNSEKFTGAADYIVTSKGDLVIGKGHDFLANNALEVGGAGRIYVKDGKIIQMTNDTGHFRTTMDEMKKTLEVLRSNNIVDPSLIKPTDLFGGN